MPPPIAALGSEQPLVKIGAAVVFSLLVAIVFTMMDQAPSATRGDRSDGSNGRQGATVAATSSRPGADVPPSQAVPQPPAAQIAQPVAPQIAPPPAPQIAQPVAAQITHLPAPQIAQPVAAPIAQLPAEQIAEPSTQETAQPRSPQIAQPPQQIAQSPSSRIPMPRAAPARAAPTIFDRYAERAPADGAGVITGGTAETTGQTATARTAAALDREEAKPHQSAGSTPGTPTECLPEGLRAVLADVEARFGPMTIVSTTHLHTDNHSSGSVREKLHLACKAVDIKTTKEPAEVMAYLRSRPEVGGVESYRNKVIHFDLKVGYTPTARNSAPTRQRQAADGAPR